MIDLHLHLLPAIDDGARDLGVSRAMLARLSDLGYRRVVATPHLVEPLYDRYATAVQEALDEVREVAKDYGVAVDLGFEHVLVPGLAERLEAGEASTLAGSRAVLVELPFVGWPQHAESSLFALQLAGYTPVLAHPERYVSVQQDRELALAVAGRGVALQLTLASFAGVFGKPVQRTAQDLLRESIERGTPVVLATDAHSDGQRLVRVDAGLRAIKKQFAGDEALVQWAAHDVPAALLSNANLPAFDASRLAGAGVASFRSGPLGAVSSLIRKMGRLRSPDE